MSDNNNNDNWFVRPSAAQGYLILKPAPNTITLHQLIGRVVKEDDARLVAVAPELLDICIDFVAFAECQCEENNPCLRCEAMEAVYKATGKDFYKTDSPVMQKAKGEA